ncbi:hypothetical protein F1B92_02060 [Campylobacter sp. FMV-PI01]|uniref:Uncharacterized protein n=1 Tax=Campylobacter portucalensis TaxID=2608384 RepID=A0A6L5WGA7_9BACT|nr:hypothetical protein [Campylobacter portucalensis]MSN95989.1 hypothetical protein [Campylobacter portucalensis]
MNLIKFIFKILFFNLLFLNLVYSYPDSKEIDLEYYSDLDPRFAGFKIISENDFHSSSDPDVFYIYFQKESKEYNSELKKYIHKIFNDFYTFNKKDAKERLYRYNYDTVDDPEPFEVGQIIFIPNEKRILELKGYYYISSYYTPYVRLGHYVEYPLSEKYIGPLTSRYLFATDCDSNRYYNPISGSCKPCPENLVSDTKGSCICENGTFNQSNGKCEGSDKKDDKRPQWCPNPMIYKNKKSFDKNIEECLPNPNIDKKQCESMGMQYHSCFDIFDEREFFTCMRVPEGCYHQKTVNKYKAEIKLDNDLFISSGFMFNIPIQGIKNGLSSFSKFIKNLFKNPNPKFPNPNLLEYKPQIIDIKATNKGPVPVWSLKPATNEDIILNSLYLKTGKIPKDIKATNLKNIDKSPQELVTVPPKFSKFDLPNDLSISKMENNSFIAAKLKDNSKPIPTQNVKDKFIDIKIEYDLSSMFKENNKPSSNLPIRIKKTFESPKKSQYEGKITTPDKSVIDIKINENFITPNRKIQDIELIYDYFSPSGKKRFTTGYVNTIDSSGKISNSVPKQGKITDIKTKKTTTNKDLSNPPAQSLDLSKIQDFLNKTNSKIDKLDKTISDIKAQKKTDWEYKPNKDIDSAFSSLRSEMANFEVSVNDAFNFLNNTKNDINKLMNDFNSALEIFEEGIEAPKIPNGICPFNISGPSPGSGKVNVFSIDPCEFVSPYKSILTLFFTFWFSFEIILFSLKYLFKVGGNE